MLLSPLPLSMWATDQQQGCSLPESLLEMQNLRPHPNVLNRNLHFSKIPRWLLFILTLRLAAVIQLGKLRPRVACAWLPSWLPKAWFPSGTETAKYRTPHCILLKTLPSCRVKIKQTAASLAKNKTYYCKYIKNRWWSQEYSRVFFSPWASQSL